MTCPSCGLENPTNALRCDCGWDFAAKQKKEPPGSRPISAAPMTLKRMLFSFEGRIPRAAYWIYSLGVLAAVGLVVVGAEAMRLEQAVGTDAGGMIVGALAIAAVVLWFWASLAVGAKRCHDLNRSGWIQLYGVIPYIGSLGLLIYLGFFRGTNGDNDYGADPLAGRK